MLYLFKIVNFFIKLPNRLLLKKHTKDIKFGKGCVFAFYPNSVIEFGKNIDLRNYNTILVAKNAKLSIGDSFFMNNFCSINCLDNISIGNNTLFGEGVKLYDHNHKYGAMGVSHKDFTKAPIKIGNNCWLGSNVVVLKGVSIGDNSIIGAGCVIHKDVPANSIIINKQEHIIKSIYYL